MISIFVAKLDFGVDSNQLRTLFEEHGKVNKASVATDRETGNSRGFGFVEMENDDEGHAAIRALDGSIVNGRNIAVKQAEERGDTRGSQPRTEQKGGYQKSNTGRPDTRSSTPGSYSPSPRPADGSIPEIAIDPLKEVRKKVSKDKEKKSPNAEVDRSKKPKMDAYKKSGKKSQFFDDDDDELEGGLFSFSDEEDED